MIKVENITKFYGNVCALDNISFEIQKGEIIGFLGPNGAGKTTTMRIITCYLSPTKGTVKIGNYDIIENPIEVKKCIGYLPENNPLYDDMGVIEYLEFIADLRNLERSIKKEQIKKVVNICGLKGVVSKNIGELSKGYRQRLGFAQAIISDPEILILDEPTSGLDPNQAREVRNLIKELKKQKTVILSTHILSEVQATCDRVLIINKGKIIASGTTDELQSLVAGKEKIYFEIRSNKDVSQNLAQIKNIENIVLIKKEDSILGYEIESKIDIREQLFEIAVENKWIVRDLHQEKISLEDVFRKLTQET